MFSRQLRAIACTIALCMGAGPLPAEDEGHSLVRFVCHRGEDQGYINRVIIVEQTSIKTIENSLADTVDGSEIIDPQVDYTDQTPFRMRIYDDVSLVSNERTKEEVIEELLGKPAGRDLNGELMDFTGTGYSMNNIFKFNSTTPYEKSLYVYLKEEFEGEVDTNNGARMMLEDGPHRCEPPTLVRQ